MKERLRYLDISKGIAIICIVLLHYDNGVIPLRANVFIGSFMISLFYVTAGWLDSMKPSQTPFKTFLSRRWKQLGVPYLWWTALILAFDCILWACGYYNTYFIGREVYKSVVLRGIGTLWFLPAQFGGEILWYFVRKQHKIWPILILLAVAVVYNFYYYRLTGKYTENIHKIISAPFQTLLNILSAWTGILGGFTLHRLFTKAKGSSRPKYLLITTGAAFCIVAYFCANYYPFPIGWGLFAPILGPFGIMLIVMGIEEWTVFRYFDFWGRQSMGLMVTHYSFLMVVCELLSLWWLGTSKLKDWPAIGFFVATMIVEYFVVKFIASKAPKLLGK